MKKFFIENDICIVVLENCYGLGKYYGEQTVRGKTYDSMDFISYHATPEQAIARYLEIQQAEALRSAPDGTIADMVKILSSERKRLSTTLSELVSLIRDWKGSAA